MTVKHHSVNQWLLTCVIALSAGDCSLLAGSAAPPAGQGLARFEARLDRIREQLAIPGLSAIVMASDTVVWEGSDAARLRSWRRGIQ
jgi:hypothetical protein